MVPYVFIFGVLCYLLGANGIKRTAEEKDFQKPVNNVNNGNENQRNYFHKRQINPEFSQLGQSVEPQFFPQSFNLPVANSFGDGRLQFPGLTAQDEEERFFLSQETTTLNPLSFINPPTTQNPIQRQQAEEQRRFQQEIADKSLREQQEQSFGVPRPSTTPPPQPQPQPQPLSLPHFQQFDQVAAVDPFFLPNSAPSAPYDDFYPVREFRSVKGKSPRSIDRQLGSLNDLGNYFSTTASPQSSQSYVDNVIQHSTPREDIAQIGNWLIDNLTKQLQRNLQQFSDSTSKRFLQSTPNPTTTPYYGQHYSTDSVALLSPVYQSTPTPTPTSISTQTQTQTTPTNWDNILQSITPTSTTANYIDGYEPKGVKNVQIIPYSTESSNYNNNNINNNNNQLTPSTVVNSFDNDLYQAYKQAYDIDHQTVKSVVVSPSPSSSSYSFTTSTTPNIDVPSFLQLINNQPQLTSNTVSVTSLFRSKLNELKENEKASRQVVVPQLNILQKGYSSDFQQPNRFFDQLQQYNETQNTPSSTPIYDNPSTAIFVKVPDDPPTSTAGFLFDKPIPKSIHKKENSYQKSKTNSRSAQIIRSSLVYRTPPGKRATASISELSQSNQIDTGLLSNFLLGEAPKSFKWLFGGRSQTTTNRPFVTALWNLIQKRSTGETV